jgi:ABC-type branched-subunit amino acid transport system substrate-binding protein
MRALALASALLTTIVVVGIGCGGGEERNGPQKLDLRIGNLVPLTGSLDVFGKPSQRAADVAVEEIRKAVAKASAAHKVTLETVDYESEPGAAVQRAGDLAKKGATCLTGPVGSGHTGRVAANVAVPRKVLEISPSASASQVSQIRDKGYLNELVPQDKVQAVALAEYMSRKLRGARGKTVNIGALDSTYGKVLIKSFEEAWRAKGGRVGKTTTYRSDATTVAPQGDALAAGNPDAWVFFDFAETYVRLGQELLKDKKADWSPRKTFGTDALANARLPSIGPLVSNGLSGVAISAPEQGKAAEAFDAAFKRTGGVTRQTFDAQEFDAVVLCYLSAVAAGSTKGADMKDELRAITAAPGRKYTFLELDQAIRALEDGQDIDYEGVSGPIELSAEGDATAGVYDIYQYRGGKLQIVDQIAIPVTGGGV